MSEYPIDEIESANSSVFAQSLGVQVGDWDGLSVRIVGVAVSGTVPGGNAPTVMFADPLPAWPSIPTNISSSRPILRPALWYASKCLVVLMEPPTWRRVRCAGR
jgi:hypothetical protein